MNYDQSDLMIVFTLCVNSNILSLCPDYTVARHVLLCWKCQKTQTCFEVRVVGFTLVFVCFFIDVPTN